MSAPARPSHLLSPLDMRDLHLQNRVALAPMTRARAGAERLANAMMAEYYTQRASAGLLITEGTTISPQANGWVSSPGIYTDEQAEAWRRVVDAVHARGSRIVLQLWHTGRASHSAFYGGKLPVAPSAVKLEGEGVHTPEGKKPHETPRALETGELPGVAADYASAAARAKAVGFDGVEVHAANGYLLDEFLQSKTNRREDGYGGSVENRFRFLGEVVEAVNEAFPGRVGVRISPNGSFNDMGSPDFRETFTYVARRLGEMGLLYLHVVDGLAFGFHELGDPMTLEEFRAVFDGPLIGCCGYDRDTAEAAITRGAADMIAFGRPYLGNPDLVERLEHGWPLADAPDVNLWFSGEQTVAGYTDVPVYAAAEAGV